GIEQFDGGTRDGAVDAGFAHIAEIRVDIDEAGQRRAAHLREVVANALLVDADRDRGVGGIRRTRRVVAAERRRIATGGRRVDRAVDVTGRLRLRDRVAVVVGRGQVAEQVTAIRAGRRGQ